MLRALLGILLCLITINTFSQRDYFKYGKFSQYGVTLIDGGAIQNAKVCRVKKENRTEEYTPYEANEYGFSNGVVYVSKEISSGDSTKKVFLERLVKGKTNLYFYKGEGIITYFLEKDTNNLIELPKKKSISSKATYNKQLLDYTNDCPDVTDAASLVTYKKNYLTRFVERYNNCDGKIFPRIKYGIIVGYGSTTISPPEEVKNKDLLELDYAPDKGFSYGIFIDNPLFVSDFSLHIGLMYSKHGFSSTKRLENTDIDYVANFSSLRMPIMLRYTIPKYKFRPYFNVGALMAYNFNVEDYQFKANITDNVITIEGFDDSISSISKTQFGYLFGLGAEISINRKNSIFFELRYDQLLGLSESKTMNLSNIQFFTGIIF